MRDPGPVVPAVVKSTVEAPYFHLADSPSADMLMQPELYAEVEKPLFAQVAEFGCSAHWIAYAAIVRLLARSLSEEMGARFDDSLCRLRQMTKNPLDYPADSAAAFEKKAMDIFAPAIKDFLVADTVDGVIGERDRLRVWR
jgi:hypothetical protein